MNCKEIKEWILTDYLDGEMQPDMQSQLERHIADCRDCKEFLSMARQLTVEPFLQAKIHEESRDAVWARLQEEIQTENAEHSRNYPESGLLERLKNILFFPKPGFAFGLLVVLLLVVFLFYSNGKQPRLAQQQQGPEQAQTRQEMAAVSVKTTEQEDYLAYYFYQEAAYADYGTSVEQYFL